MKQPVAIAALLALSVMEPASHQVHAIKVDTDVEAESLRSPRGSCYDNPVWYDCYHD